MQIISFPRPGHIYLKKYIISVLRTKVQMHISNKILHGTYKKPITEDFHMK